MQSDPCSVMKLTLLEPMRLHRSPHPSACRQFLEPVLRNAAPKPAAPAAPQKAVPPGVDVDKLWPSQDQWEQAAAAPK